MDADLHSFSATSKTVKIHVGQPTPQEFTVHKQILIDNSNFFAAYLQENIFGHGKEELVEFPDDDAELFALTVDYMYRRQVQEHDIKASISLYNLAEKLGMEDFQNAIVDYVRRYFSDNQLNSETLRSVQTLLDVPKTPLYEYFTDLVAYETISNPRAFVQGKGINIAPDEHTSTFVNGASESLMKAMYVKTLCFLQRLQTSPKGWTKADPSGRPGCYYHVHEDGKTCGAK